MRKFWLMAAFAAFGCTYSGTAAAAEYDYYQTTGVRQVAHNLNLGGDCGCAPEATCCAPEANACCDDGCCGTCDSCCGVSCCGLDWFGDCCLGEAWKAYTPCECSQFDAGGWVQIGYHTEGVNGIGTGLFNNYPNRVQLHQLWLWAERSTNTGGCGWDFGYRVDAVYGTDGPDTQAFGARPDEWDNPWDYGGAYGAAIPQLYGTVAYNDLTVKIGHFYTIIGYEVVPATGNFFYSHSYSQYLAEPFTHGGVLGEFAYNDAVTLWGGWTAGWDTAFSSFGGGNIFLGGVRAELTDNVAFTYGLTYGDFGYGPGNSDNDGYSHSIVVDWNINCRWNYVFQSDFIDNDAFLGDTDNLWSVNQYLFYTLNDCWKFGIRGEVFDDPRLGDEAYQVTLGLNYKPHANVVIRPEVRFNEFDPGVGARDEAIFGIDAILTF